MVENSGRCKYSRCLGLWYVIDEHGRTIAMCTIEEDARKITEALNAPLCVTAPSQGGHVCQH